MKKKMIFDSAFKEKRFDRRKLINLFFSNHYQIRHGSNYMYDRMPFDIFHYLLLSALRKTPKLSKEAWFDELCKRLLHEHQTAYESFWSKIDRKIGFYAVVSKQTVQFLKRNRKISPGSVSSHLRLLKVSRASSICIGDKKQIVK